MSRLNGWIRLWIVIAAAWMFVIAAAAFLNWPTYVYLPDHPKRSALWRLCQRQRGRVMIVKALAK